MDKTEEFKKSILPYCEDIIDDLRLFCIETIIKMKSKGADEDEIYCSILMSLGFHAAVIIKTTVSEEEQEQYIKSFTRDIESLLKKLEPLKKKGK